MTNTMHVNVMDDIYQKLTLGTQEIRLITLLPGEHEDNISCAFSVVYLANAPSYEALSYVWGDSSSTLPIVLDGQDSQVTMTWSLRFEAFVIMTGVDCFGLMLYVSTRKMFKSVTPEWSK